MLDSLFMPATLSAKVVVPYDRLGSNVEEHLIARIARKFEGKCCAQGYVQTGSCKMVRRSGGRFELAGLVYEVTFSCNICVPVAGQKLSVKCKTKSRAGIHAIVVLDDASEPAPLDVLVLMDQVEPKHREIMEKFNEGEIFTVKVEDYNFQLEDKTIVVICSFSDLV